MGNIRVDLIKDKATWDGYLLSNNPKSFLQSWNWGETNKIVGHKVFRFGYFQGRKLLGVSQIIEERARRGPYFVIPAGPFIDWKNTKLVNITLKNIKDLAGKEKVWFVRIRPEVEDGEKIRMFFKKLGFLPAPMHLHGENTLVVDIQGTEEQILANMRKNTRYSIRKSLKENLVCEIYNTSKRINVLTKLQKETVERHKFVGFKQSLFKAQLDTFGQDKQAALFVCRKGGQDLVAAIIIFYGDCAYYHHSGSSEKSRKTEASYFLQWSVINEARRRGCKYYNLWGIAPDDNPHHRFAGVTIFKKGFGGKRIDWLHAQDLPITPMYSLTRTFETVRKKMRRL